MYTLYCEPDCVERPHKIGMKIYIYLTKRTKTRLSFCLMGFLAAFQHVLAASTVIRIIRLNPPKTRKPTL